MPTIQVFNDFKEKVAEGVHDLGSDTLKVVLTNTPVSLADMTLGDLEEIPAGNGYPAGGVAAPVTGSAQSGGTYTLALGAVTITATGGDVGPFRYFVLYNDTTPDKNLIAFGDYGTAYTLPSGSSFTVNAGAWIQNA